MKKETIFGTLLLIVVFTAAIFFASCSEDVKDTPEPEKVEVTTDVDSTDVASINIECNGTCCNHKISKEVNRTVKFKLAVLDVVCYWCERGLPCVLHGPSTPPPGPPGKIPKPDKII